MYREILLTYRLLFGQSAKARRLLNQHLDNSPDGMPDPFIKVCTSPLPSKQWYIWRQEKQPFPGFIFPISALDLHGQVQDSDTYSAQDDFPFFGSKLLILQRYNMRQQPKKVQDLWRDHRNPLQWYTFWAVIFVGGAGILLAILQVAIGLVQMYYAIPG